MSDTKKVKKGDQVTLVVDKLVFGGQGIGQVDGLKVFVSGVAPDDEWSVNITKVRNNYAEGTGLELLKASPIRVKPRCKHFDTCGGCTWQFLSYEDQLKVKHDQVLESLEHLGGLQDVPMLPIIGCETPWNYRNKMELSFGTSMNGDLELGFHPPSYHHEVFNMQECFLMSDTMLSLVKDVREWAIEEGLKPYHGGRNEGLLRNLIVREGQHTGERMMVIVTSEEEFPVESFVARFSTDKRITSLYQAIIHQMKGRATQVEEKYLSGRTTLREELTLEDGVKLSFDILPFAFFQTNSLQAEKLYQAAILAADLNGGETVFDLYCGTGTIGLFMAQKAKRVYGIDLNVSAIENARRNAELNGVEHVEYSQGNTQTWLTNPPAKPSVIVVDPPRVGLGEELVKQVAAFKAPKIVYVSCNPSTLARDLKQFVQEGYELVSVQPVDMFPQTYHIESVCSLRLK